MAMQYQTCRDAFGQKLLGNQAMAHVGLAIINDIIAGNTKINRALDVDITSTESSSNRRLLIAENAKTLGRIIGRNEILLGQAFDPSTPSERHADLWGSIALNSSKISTLLNECRFTHRQLAEMYDGFKALAAAALKTLPGDCTSSSAQRLRELGETAEGLKTRCVELETLLRKTDHAKNDIATSNLRLVVSIAKQFQNKGLPLLDLIQEGNTGLLRAIEKFEPERGLKFSTYASWWIKQKMRRAIEEQARPVRGCANVNRKIAIIRETERQLTHELGRAPHDFEIADACGIETKHLRELVPLMKSHSSLTAAIDQEGGTLLNLLEDKGPSGHSSQESAFNHVALKEALASALSTVDHRSRDILRKRSEDATLRDIGEELGVSRERVRQLEAKALKKLTRPQVVELLQPFLAEEE